AFTEPSEVRKHLDTHHSESTTAPKPENSEYDHEETERIPNTSGKHGISESLLQYPYDQIVGGANDHDKFSSERVEIGVKTEPLDEAMDDRSFSSCTADVSHSYARGDGHSLGSEGALDFTLARREASGNGCTSPSKSKETIDGLYENACTSGETHHNHDAEQELFQSTGDVETDSESCGGSNLSVIAKREAVSPEMQSEEHDYVAEVLHGKDHAIPSTSVAHTDLHRKDSHPETQPTPNVPAVELPRTPPFVCPFCGRNFARKETLQFHTYTHTKEKPFKCDECDKGFIRRFLLRQHKRMEHPHNEEVAMDHLSQHMMDIHPETQPTPSVPAVELPRTSPFGCQFCGRTFARKETLQLHTYAHTGEKPFACDECDKGFVRHFLLRQHKRMEHPQNEEVAVDHPSQHMTAGHPETQPSPSVLAVEVPRTPPFVCPFCGRNFARKQTLQCHIYTHTRETPFKCDECDKGFIRRFLLRQHKRMDHPQNGEAALDPRPFVCHICSRNFHKKDTWQNHMFTHTHEKPYKCEECDKSFIRPCKLTQHMQQYHPEIQAAIERLDGVRCRPYVCTVCHMSFSGNDTLQSHMSTNHAEETTFQCEAAAKFHIWGGGGLQIFFFEFLPLNQLAGMADVKLEMSDSTADALSQDGHLQARSTSSASLHCCCLCPTGNQAEYTEFRVKAEPFQEDKDSAIVSRENSEEFLPQTQTEGTNQVLASQNMKFVNPDYTCKHPHEKSFQCKDCDKHFFASSSLAKHIIKEHPEHKDSAEAKPHECQ
ncbi:hypothetical protein BaRGS_00012013, partial [Batillaria attramentaria]